VLQYGKLAIKMRYSIHRPTTCLHTWYSMVCLSWSSEYVSLYHPGFHLRVGLGYTCYEAMDGSRSGLTWGATSEHHA